MSRRLTLLLVRELYTFSTGSSASGVGLYHSGCAEDGLAASLGTDMLMRRANGGAQGRVGARGRRVELVEIGRIGARPGPVGRRWGV